VKKQTTTSSKRTTQQDEYQMAQQQKRPEGQRQIDEQEISFEMLIPDKKPKFPARQRSKPKQSTTLKPAYIYREKKTVEENPFLPPSSSNSNPQQLVIQTDSSKAQSNVRERQDVSKLYAQQQQASPQKQSKSATRPPQAMPMQEQDQPYF
jgi:hypothetical protein